MGGGEDGGRKRGTEGDEGAREGWKERGGCLLWYWGRQHTRAAIAEVQSPASLGAWLTPWMLVLLRQQPLIRSHFLIPGCCYSSYCCCSISAAGYRYVVIATRTNVAAGKLLQLLSKCNVAAERSLSLLLQSEAATTASS